MRANIQYLPHAEIDKVKWDDTIARSSNGMIYAFSWYLDIVCPGWDALVGDDYASVMPLTWRKKAGIKYLFQPPFTQQLGVFSLSQKITEAEVLHFLNAVPQAFKYLDIFLNHHNLVTPAKESTLRIVPRVNHHLPLGPEYPLLRKNYSENLLRNLKKADHQEWRVDRETSYEEVITLFRKNRGKNLDTLGNKEYTLLKVLLKRAQQKNAVSVYGVHAAANHLSGAVFLHSNREYIFLFSATGDEGKKTGAMSAILDQFIRDHSTEKMLLDFEGSMDKNLSRFYKSFGADEIVYLHIQRNRLPGIVRWLKN